ncbi:MAG: RNA 2',3'-cyclic phosphodiesterase [Candidatus Aenigmatarchaeota archaeon]
MRCFVGFFVPEPARRGLVALQDQLRKLPADCKYVEPENLHVCLSFLGEVDEPAVAATEAKLESVCKEIPPFRAITGGIRMIPSERRVRVVALDLRDAADSLQGIADSIRREVGGDAKPPHITLCRVRSIREKDASVKGMQAIHVGKMEFGIGEIALIKSELGSGGPVYSAVKRFELKAC